MADTTLTIPISPALDRELERVASATGHSKADVALEALACWLEEQGEVREILSRVDRNEPSSTLDEVMKRLGVDDWPEGRYTTGGHTIDQ